MNELTEKLTGKYEPKQAIVVYEWQKNYYLESHVIDKGKMLSGKPLTEDTLNDLVEFFQERKKQNSNLKGIVPSNMIYCDWSAEKKVLVWYRTAEKRMMHFTENLHIPIGEAWQPDLLYVVKESELYVFAMKAYLKDHKSRLCAPPYHNCSRNGSVCLGSAKVKRKQLSTYQEVIDHYELLFWGSEFSHLAAETTNTKCNLNTYWKQAIKTKKEFDLDILTPIKNLTIKKLLSQL